MPPAINKSTYNHVLNHVAISVPDCDLAVKWYCEVLGFRNLRSIRHTKRETAPTAPIFKIYGGALQEVRSAWLGTGNSVGFEIFEFIDPKYRGSVKPREDGGFEYLDGGFFHIAITAPDPEGLCEKVVEAGGRKIGETVELFDGDVALYLQDPWGNVIEVLSCSFEQLMANRG